MTASPGRRVGESGEAVLVPAMAATLRLHPIRKVDKCNSVAFA
jgi:hypothetical protein